MTWILSRVREALEETHPPAFLRWDDFTEAKTGLFLWEAFVSGSAKGANDQEDALLAVRAFREQLPRPNSAVTEERAISLAGLALLHTGWRDDAQILGQPCLVIKVEG